MQKLPAFAASLVIGPVVGSFIANWALRYARREQALSGRSRCDHCAVELKFAQTVPLLSFAIGRGRCHACGGPIDPLHPAGELAGALVMAAALSAATPAEVLLRIVVGLSLLALVIVDLKIGRLPNLLNLLAALGCAGIALVRGEFVEGLVAAAAVGLLFQALRLAIRRGGVPGMGLGDVKLGIGLGLWLGLASSWMIILACLFGLFCHLVLKPDDGRTPFGPALALSALVVATCRDMGLMSAWT